MNRGAWFLFFLSLVMWASYEGNRQPGQPHIPPVLPPVASPLIKAGLEFLGLGFKIATAQADDKCVKSPNNKVTGKDETLCPQELIDKNKLTTRIDVEQYDKNARRALKECTKIGNRSADNYISMLEIRSKCLRGKGYDRNEMTYMGEKFNENPS